MTFSCPCRRKMSGMNWRHGFLKGQMCRKQSAILSGGEKARLVLAEILEKRPNFLMLDEPTNHMDIPARETLESAFRAYKGTMLFISHDRYFVEQVADALLIFENGRVPITHLDTGIIWNGWSG